MIKNIFLPLFFFSLVFSLVFTGFIRFAKAIGVSPALIEVNNLVQNIEVVKEINFSRAQSANQATFQVSLSGSAAEYIELSNKGIVTMDPGVNVVRYPFTIKPQSLGEGAYEVNITIQETAPDKATSKSEGTGSTILTGAQATIRFTVINQELESYGISDIRIGEAEEGQAIGFSFRLQNSGNVDTRPERIEFTTIDETDETNTYQETILKERIRLVKAFKTDTISVATNAQLLPSLYKVLIIFYDKTGKKIFESSSLRLQVFPKGTLAQKGELISLQTDKPSYQNGEIVKFLGTFQNTGDIGVNANLVIEIFKNNQRLEVLKTEPLFVPIKQKLDIDATWRPNQAGSYAVKGYATYGPHKTEQLETTFIVRASSAFAVIAFLAGFTLVIGAVIFFIARRKKNAI